MSDNVLIEVGKKVFFDANRTIFRENDPGDKMYIPLSGSFGVYVNSLSDAPIKVATISAGGFFGEMSLIDNSPRSATVIAESNSMALEIDQSSFFMLLEKNPRITKSILETLSERLRQSKEELEKKGKIVDASLAERLMLMNEKKLEQTLKLNSEMIFRLMKNISKQMRDFNLLRCKTSDVTVEAPKPPHTVASIRPVSHPDYGVVEVEIAKLYYDDLNITCPICGNNFETQIPLVAALKKESNNDKDLRTHYKNVDIIWYSPCICNVCGHADFYSSFSQVTSEQTKLWLSAIKQKKPDFDGFLEKRTINDVINSYYQIATCGEIMNKHPLTLAKAYMRLYWLYKDVYEEQLSRAAAVAALYYYNITTEVYLDSFAPAEQIQITTTAAELALWLGEYEKGAEYYLKNISIGKLANYTLYRQAELALDDMKIVYEHD